MSEDTDYDSWQHFQEQVRTSLRGGGVYIYPLPEESRGANTTRHGTYLVSFTSPEDIRSQLGWGGSVFQGSGFRGGKVQAVLGNRAALPRGESDSAVLWVGGDLRRDCHYPLPGRFTVTTTRRRISMEDSQEWRVAEARHTILEVQAGLLKGAVLSTGMGVLYADGFSPKNPRGYHEDEIRSALGHGDLYSMRVVIPESVTEGVLYWVEKPFFPGQNLWGQIFGVTEIIKGQALLVKKELAPSR